MDLQATPKTTQISGHFGELLQGRLGPTGPIALITLPCPALHVHAYRTEGPFRLTQSTEILTEAQARDALALLDLPQTGHFTLRADMPPGGGAGASTAARLALAHAAGSAHSPEDLARACIACEGASDPLMYPNPERLLWASRQGAVLAHLPALPALDVIGGFFGAPQLTRASDTDFPDISDLVALWPAACTSANAVANLTSQSAARSLHLRGPKADPTAALAGDLGALGWAMAHTGSARALLFAPGKIPANAQARLTAAGLRQITRFSVGGPL